MSFKKLLEASRAGIIIKDFLEVQDLLQKNSKLPKNPKAREAVLYLLRKAAHWNINELTYLFFKYVPDTIINKINDLEDYLAQISTRCIYLLMKSGVRITSPEYMENSPAEIIFHRSNLKNREEMLKLLLYCGIDLKYRNGNGENLLHLFIHRFADEDDHDAVDISRILLDTGLPLDEPSWNEKGYTPLIFAIKSNNINLISYLIKKGANVNKMCPKGIFPLFQAAKYNNVEIIDLLLKSGAEINAKTKYGSTALHRACKFFHTDTISFLLEKGARVCITDEQGRTPFANLKPEFYANYDIVELGVIIDMVTEIARENSFCNSSVNKLDLDLIQGNLNLQRFFNKCHEELSQMKNSKFYPPYSFHSVLKMVKNIKKLAALTKNEEFVRNFKDNFSFNIYKDHLQRLLDQAIKVRDEILTVESRLMNIFGKIFPDCVIRKLTENLKVEDLPLE